MRLALLCSNQCPGSLVVASLDCVSALITATMGCVISGFQSPVERECLKFLLKGSVQLVVCPARSAIGMRIPAAWKPAIAAGRLTIRSPFDENDEAGGDASTSKAPRRATAKLAELRNRFVADISDAVLILHATPGGKLDRLATDLLATDKPVWTLDDPTNAALIAKGARPVIPDAVATIWRAGSMMH
jgi:hypothetical protein